jgi:hypothetical protein
MTGMLLAHHGQCRMDHIEHAEQVGLQLTAEILRRHLLERGGESLLEAD